MLHLKAGNELPFPNAIETYSEDPTESPHDDKIFGGVLLPKEL
jgi:hypothetical protein